MEWDANLYKEHSDLQFRIGKVAIVQLKPRDGERILEIGCGTGGLTALIAKSIPRGRITAVDISRNMVEKTRQTLIQSGVHNVEFECLDAMAMTYNNEFDAIFSNAVIHLICWKDLLFQRLYEALRPGGRIVLTAPFTQIPDTRKDLQGAHFTNINLQEQVFDADVNELLLCMQSALPDIFVKNQSPRKQERRLKTLKNMLGAMYSEDTKQGDRNNVRFTILVIAAEKPI